MIIQPASLPWGWSFDWRTIARIIFSPVMVPRSVPQDCGFRAGMREAMWWAMKVMVDMGVWIFCVPGSVDLCGFVGLAPLAGAVVWKAERVHSYGTAIDSLPGRICCRKNRREKFRRTAWWPGAESICDRSASKTHPKIGVSGRRCFSGSRRY
jgi:hypothetical protein